MAINNNMGLADLEEISDGVAGVASLLSAIQIGQESGDSFDQRDRAGFFICTYHPLTHDIAE